MATLAMAIAKESNETDYLEFAIYYLELIEKTEQSKRVLLMVYRLQGNHEMEKAVAIDYLNTHRDEVLGNRKRVVEHLIRSLIEAGKNDELASVCVNIDPELTAMLLGGSYVDRVTQGRAGNILSVSLGESFRQQMLIKFAYTKENNIFSRLLAAFYLGQEEVKILGCILKDWFRVFLPAEAFHDIIRKIHSCPQPHCAYLDRAYIGLFLIRELIRKELFAKAVQLLDEITEIHPARGSYQFTEFLEILKQEDSSLRECIKHILAKQNMTHIIKSPKLEPIYLDFELHIRRAVALKRQALQMMVGSPLPEQPEPAQKMTEAYKAALEHGKNLDSLAQQIQIALSKAAEADVASPEVILLQAEAHRLLALIALNQLKQACQQHTRYRR